MRRSIRRRQLRPRRGRQTDYFVSFVIPFADVVSALAAQGISGFNDAAVMRFVIGSSTQPNALNQDLGGPNGGTSSTQTWAQLGAISNSLTSSGGFLPVPEPGTASRDSLGLRALAARTASARRSRLAAADHVSSASERGRPRAARG